MGDATFTFRLDQALKAAFTQAAKASDHNAAQLLRQLMRDYVQQQEAKAAEEAWLEREIAAGLREADDPNAVWLSEDDVKAATQRLRQRLVKKLAEQERNQ